MTRGPIEEVGREGSGCPCVLGVAAGGAFARTGRGMRLFEACDSGVKLLHQSWVKSASGRTCLMTTSNDDFRSHAYISDTCV